MSIGHGPDAITPHADPVAAEPHHVKDLLRSPPPAPWTTASRRWSGGCSTTPSRCSPTRSRPCGARRSQGPDDPDLSLLVDGLRAEREQGITIDVAYRYFSTPQREFVLADTPGHVQYTRNTVTGASTAELAVLLVDARNGVIEQTRRHAAVLALLRVPHLVLAINKIDLVGYDEDDVRPRSRRTSPGWRASLGFPTTPSSRSRCRPWSATTSSTARSTRPGTTARRCSEHLESVPVVVPEGNAPFRIPGAVRDPAAHRRAPDYRGYAGQVAAGTVSAGDEVVVLPAGLRTTVAAVDTADGPLDVAGAGRSVTVLLADDIDISRGDLLAAAAPPSRVTDELETTVCWLAEKPLRPGARLLLKHGTRTTQVIVGAITERLDPDTLAFVEPPGAAADQRHRARRPAHRGRRCPSTSTRTSAPPAASCSSTRRRATRSPPG